MWGTRYILYNGVFCEVMAVSYKFAVAEYLILFNDEFIWVTASNIS